MLRASRLSLLLTCGVFYASCGGRAESSDAVSARGGGAGVAGAPSAQAGAQSLPLAVAGAAGEPALVVPNAGAGGGGGADDCESDTHFAVSPAISAGSHRVPSTLSKIATHDAWSTAKMVGMAADEQGSVYIASGDDIERFDGKQLSAYLSVQEAASSAGLSVASGFRALDVDPNGALYSVLSSTVIRSNSAHSAGIWRSYPSLAVQLGVMAVDDVVLISMQSMYRVLPHCAQRLFTNGEFLGLDCGGAQLSVARSGVFLYSADCGVNQLYRGTSDGAKFDVVYSASEAAPAPLFATQLLCSTRDPVGGGFLLVVADGNGDWQLFHLDENLTGDLSTTRIQTTPSFAEARAAEATAADPNRFASCKLAATASAQVFLQTGSELWQLDP